MTANIQTPDIADLGISALSDEQKAAFDRDGFFIVEGHFSAAECEWMADAADALWALEGENAGSEVSQEDISRRLSNLFNKSDQFDSLMAIGPSVAAAQYLFGDFRLHGANIREPLQGAGQQQLHSDVVKDGPAEFHLVNTMVALDDVTIDNGPTRVVAGSHKWPFLNVPVENLPEGAADTDTESDPGRVPADPWVAYPGEQYVTLKRGSIAVINAHLWHSGTTNRSGDRRRLATISYSRRDITQQVDQRAALTPGLDARLTPSLRWVLDVA